MSDTVTKDVFCILPFVQTVVRTDGYISSCCNIIGTQNIRQSSIQQFWSSDELSDFKNRILDNDQNLTQCNKCYQEEEFQGSSMRTQSLKNYKFFSSTHYKKLLDHFEYSKNSFPSRVEWHLGNLCNLKCLTCDPRDSSSFLTENYKLKINNYNQSQFTLDDDVLNANLQLIFDNKIDILDLRGGESMMIPQIKKILLTLSDQQYQRTTLRVQTNGTVLDDDWKIILSKFAQVEIMLSIDAYGLDNTYIRYPSSWSTIEQNTDYFMSLPNANVFANCTISNLNFPVLHKLAHWAESKQLFVNYSFVDHPRYYNFKNLPKPVFDVAKQQAAKCNGLQNLITVQADNTHWEDFCKMIDLRDKHRNNSIFDVLPELKPYWI